MKKKMVRIVAGFAAFALLFTILPIATGEFEVSAASRPRRVRSISARKYGTNGAKVNWKRPSRKGISGYVVYRNGKRIRRVSYKTRTIYNTELNPGTYKYSVRSYKTYRRTQWYNKRTKKWQYRRPARRNRGKRRRVTRYSYSYLSPVRTVTIPESAPVEPPESETPENPDVTSETKSVTDYLGVTRTITKYSDEAYWYDEGGRQMKPYARFDRTADGTFVGTTGDDYGKNFVQMNGVTFNSDQLYDQIGKETIDYEAGSHGVKFMLEMYNGDSEKLSLEIQNPIETIDTYSYEQDPIQKKYVMKDNKRLLEYIGVVDKPIGETGILRKICFGEDKMLNTGVGFTKGTILIKASYDGQELSTWHYDINSNAISVESPYADYLSPDRKAALDIALTAVEAGGDGTYHKDMIAIENYIRETYNYTDTFGSKIQLDCIGGAIILETYSIYKYGIYGFDSYGGYGNPTENPNHIAFHLNSNPVTYYETNGHH